MNAPHISTKPALPRRHFLRGTGAALLGLPALDAMLPCFSSRAEAAAGARPPKRFVAICAGLGFHAPFLFPKTPGTTIQSTPYLDILKDHHQDFTLFSGLSHPKQQGNNGHASLLTWLTSAQRPGLAGFKNTVSIDQLIANHHGAKTRYPYLALAAGGGSLSWTSNGVEIPAQHSPSLLFKRLFLDGTEKEIDADVRELARGRSILDTVGAEAQKLHRNLGHRDQEKLDEYLTSVRDLEVRLQQGQEWARRPKPKIDAAQPKDIDDRNDAIGRQRLMNDMTVLALQTDSTRTVTVNLGTLNSPPSNIPGVNTDWHNLSHHGKDEDKIDELQLIEKAEFAAFNDFLNKLKAAQETDGSSLLEQTSVLFGSNLGNASSHDWRNLPIIVAGGGFKHGQYLAHNADDNTPLANLFVQIANQTGVPIERFGSSTRTSIQGFS